MIFYLFDFFVNNLNIFICATILFKVGKYTKKDFLFLLFIDIFINYIPIVFISVFFLDLLSKWLKKVFVNSFILDQLLFLLNYIFFFLIIFILKNKSFIVGNLFEVYLSNFFINYILFLLFDKTLLKRYRKERVKKIFNY